MSYGSAGAFSGYSPQSGARRRSLPLWTPAELGSKLYMRFNPGTLVLANNDPIGSWLGTGVEPVTVTASGTDRPTFKTGGDGGMPYAYFDGNDIMQATLANDLLKFQYDEGITFLASILRDPSDSAGNRRTIFGSGNDANHPQAETGGSYAAAFIQPGTYILSSSAGPSLSDRILTAYRSSNATAQAYAEINGASSATSFSAYSAPTTTPSTWAFLLGARAVGSQCFWGHVYDACWVRGEATLVERQKYAGWAAWNRGRVADLPADHPYKLAPPYL